MFFREKSAILNSDVCGNNGEGGGLLKSFLSVKLTVEELLVYYINGKGVENCWKGDTVHFRLYGFVHHFITYWKIRKKIFRDFCQKIADVLL